MARYVPNVISGHVCESALTDEKFSSYRFHQGLLIRILHGASKDFHLNRP